MSNSIPKRVLIGVTGSVAAIKVPELIEKLLDSDSSVEVRVVVTEHAQNFIALDELHTADHSVPSLPMIAPLNTHCRVRVYKDDSEWRMWSGKGDPVLHIELRKWCDVFILCPLDANTLAKIANGICDNLLTCIARAWSMDKPFIICPAMNSAMWTNPLTQVQLNTLRSVYSVLIVEPKSEYHLACGDVGPGALADVNEIVECIGTQLSLVSSKHL